MDEYIIHVNRREKTEALRSIEEAIDAMYGSDDGIAHEAVVNVLEAIRSAINNGDRFIIPVEVPQPAVDVITDDGIKVGETVGIPDGLSVNIKTLRLKNGTDTFVAFTDYEKAMAGEGTSTITADIESYLEKALMNPDVEGITLNPWNRSCHLPKSYIRMIFENNLPVKRENIIYIGTADITQAEVTCIVNAANNSLLGGGGVDGAIHRAAGPGLLAECRTLGGCETGGAKITKGYNLKADYIIHTVGPIYSGRGNDARMLRRCYWSCLELARKNDIHSIAFPAISTGVYGYPLEDATEIALSSVNDWLKVNSDYGMAIMFACFDDRTTEIYREISDRQQEQWNLRPIVRENNGTLEKAMRYAMECHKGAVRKGSERPYILHPIETLQILAAMNADTNLMAAGLLHDTLEDTDAVLTDIYEQFGADVAELVSSHTEDKRKIWYMRKLQTIAELPDSTIRHKMLVMADKVSNLRSMYADYKRIGDELWQRFNAPKELQAWYYSKIADGLDELQNYAETEDIYWEMIALYKDLFVTFAADEEKGLLYQLGADGDNKVLKKGKPQWIDLDGNVSKNAKVLPRKAAERLEDNWAEPFWDTHFRDLADADYELFSSDDRILSVRIHDGRLTFSEHEPARECESTDGKEPCGCSYYLDEKGTHRFLAQLRLKHSLRNKLITILKNEFGRDDGSERFKAFCDEVTVDRCCS